MRGNHQVVRGKQHEAMCIVMWGFLSAAVSQIGLNDPVHYGLVTRSMAYRGLL